MDRLGVVSYGISITTLEEVFLHINKEFGIQLQVAEENEDDAAVGELERNLDEINKNDEATLV